MSYDELKGALRETLDRKGVLGALRAQMRAEVFHAVDEQSDVRPGLSNEQLLLNEAIREYLTFTGYHHTLSVFMAEAGQPAEPLRREFLASQLHLPVPRGSAPPPAGSADIPLLYSLVPPARI